MRSFFSILIATYMLGGCITIPAAPISGTDMNLQFSGNSIEIEDSGDVYYLIPDGSLIFRNKKRDETRAGIWFAESIQVKGKWLEVLCFPSGRTGNTLYKGLRCFNFTDENYNSLDQRKKYWANAYNCDGTRVDGLKCHNVGGGFAFLVKTRPVEDLNGRFVRNDKFTVLDNKTGLMWMTCTLGQESHILEACETPPVKFRKGFDEIESYIIKFNRSGYAGHHDWRLPTFDELSSLVWCGVDAKPKEGDYCSSIVSKGQAKVPAISSIFALPEHLYISSSRSTEVYDPKIKTAGVVNFYYGVSQWSRLESLFNPSSQYSYVVVRLVRGGSHAPKK